MNTSFLISKQLTIAYVICKPKQYRSISNTCTVQSSQWQNPISHSFVSLSDRRTFPFKYKYGRCYCRFMPENTKKEHQNADNRVRLTYRWTDVGVAQKRAVSFLYDPRLPCARVRLPRSRTCVNKDDCSELIELQGGRIRPPHKLETRRNAITCNVYRFVYVSYMSELFKYARGKIF